MGQGGKGWRRCQACRSEPPKARGRHRSFEISLSLSLSLSLPVSVFRPPFSSLLALARAVSVTPRSLFVPSFRAAFSVGPSLVSLSVNLRTGWWDGRVGRGGAEGGSVGRATCACPRHTLRPRRAYRRLIRAYVRDRVSYTAFVYTAKIRVCAHPRGAWMYESFLPPPLRPATHPPPPHCCCCSCVGSRSRYPAAPPHSERYPSNTFEPPYRISECLAAIYPPIPVAMYSPPSPL